MGVTAGDGDAAVADLRALVTEVARERDLLADEVHVKAQMCVTLANGYASVQAALDAARAASSDKDNQLQSNVNEVTTLRQQVQQLTSRAGVAERRGRELEAELQAARHTAADAEKRLEGTSSIEADLAKAVREKEDMQKTMDEWKGKVKEALKENRKKEQQYAQSDIEQKRQISKLQEMLDKANFELETLRLRETMQRPKAHSETQTDPMPQLPSVQSFVAPQTPLLSVSSGVTLARPMSPGAPPLPLSEPAFRSPTPELTRSDAMPLMSPPPIKPLGDDAPQPPMIVTVHYGSSDGWTVDTKTMVKGGDTVADVIVDVCERVNSRYGRNLDCASMCLKTHHSKAKRFVVLSEHREVHSFAYFKKSIQDGKPINLYLEPLPEGAVFTSPAGGGARAPSAARGMSASRGR